MVMPYFASIHASHSGAWIMDSTGNTRVASKGEAITASADTPHLLLNAPLIASRLGYPNLSGYDLLELFAFIHPALFMVPTPEGLARAVNIEPPADEAAVPAMLNKAASALLQTCASPNWAERDGAWSALQSLLRLRWPWAALLLEHVKQPTTAEPWLFSRLPEWEEAPERPQPKQVSLSPEAVSARLSDLVGENAEQRSSQQAYANEVAHTFDIRGEQGTPHIILAEAGTGTGKTLGYLAPASLWAQKSGGSVWVSTYTKALQRQLRRESARAWPDHRADGSHPVVIRKGRENYLCLLNLEDALQGGFSGRSAILAHLAARWAAYTRDGDMIGGDFPGWLGSLFHKRGITSLTDQRGECIYAACPHYRKCYIERAIRTSKQADLVIANHALVMLNAARAQDNGEQFTRIIFDEGHHVFDAADSTFSITFSGSEAIELRRWIMGPERARRGRRRGLAARLADIASYDEQGSEAISDALAAADALPGEGWLQRIHDNNPSGPVEDLLHAVRMLVYARDESAGQDAGYGLETEITQVDGITIEKTQTAQNALARLRQPLMRLAARLEKTLIEAPDWLDSHGRARVEGARNTLKWRIDLIAAWEALLERVGGPSDPEFIDWFAIDRFESREFDIGIHRRWLDPMKPFSQTVAANAHGMLITSATLRDENDWAGAIQRSGAPQLNIMPHVCAYESPFDYAGQAEVLIVTDIKRGDTAALAGGYARLIEAADGGVLGLFTAIRRLRAVHARIADRLARHGIPLYAQHIDPIDTGTLVDIFRDDPRASLLGTDALRDGVDVSGDSLRLVILEQVPWSRPSILHRARRSAAIGGGKAYDDYIVRSRLRQAFGRLIRTRCDSGKFVVLSSAFPSRLLTAFPQGTPVQRVTLNEALQIVKSSASGQKSSLVSDSNLFL